MNLQTVFCLDTIDPSFMYILKKVHRFYSKYTSICAMSGGTFSLPENGQWKMEYQKSCEVFWMKLRKDFVSTMIQLSKNV